MSQKTKIWPGIPVHSYEMLPYLQDGISQFNESKAHFIYTDKSALGEITKNTSGMIIMILDGVYSAKGYFDDSEQTKTLGGGDIVFIEEKRWSSPLPGLLNYSGLSIIFYPDYTRMVYSKHVDSKVVENPYYHTNDSVRGSTQNILQALNRVLKNRAQHNHTFLQLRATLLKALLLQLESDIRAEELQVMNKEEHLIRQINTYIQYNYSTPINCHSISEAFQLNPCYLATLFKRATGIYLKDALKKQRLEQAKYMLIHYRSSVKDIAIKCGYTNISYFIKNFKEAYQVTPGYFRQLSNSES
jgi:AraC-like DNA-binding protein